MAWIAPIVVEAQRREQEEQLLASLVAEDKEDRYEFKILHGGLGAFRKPERLQAVLDEEARAQWQLAVKLDDERLVLRRPRTAQARDVLLGENADPYRTQLGGGRGRKALLAGLILLTVITGGLVALFLGGGEAPAGGPMVWPVAAILIIVPILVLLLALIRRRE